MQTPGISFDPGEFERYVLTNFGKSPYRFQVSVAERLLAGHNVIALAPTGAGKTLAPIAAFAYAKRRGLPFADRLIYALPQRTLTMALHRSVTDDLKRVAPELRVTIQTGNVPEDPYFEGDVIFTTIDQLLSAYIEVPVSLPNRLANVSAGALLGALIVFDEFHLLEPGRALATVLDLARQLKPYTRTLLMSATFPRSGLEEVVARAEAILVEVGPEEIDSIPSQRNKRRTYMWHPEPITAESVLNGHRDRSIVVVNRVDRAQDLYEAIKKSVAERNMDVRVLLLHSRFLQPDRQAREKEVIDRFKREGLGRAILVATQVVEVGLDITCETLHTEVATASALFQRAGRCARYAGESGTMHVYELEQTQRGRRYGPYRQDARIVDALAGQMESRTGSDIAFAIEQEIVNLTHGDIDLDRLSAVSWARRRQEVTDAQRAHAAGFVRILIREVDSVSILIHSNPGMLDLAKRPETFSLPRSVLRQLLSGLDRANGYAGKVRWPEFPDSGEDGYSKRPEWKPLLRAKDADSHFLLAIHPDLASYDEEYGLRLLPPNPGGYESRTVLPEADRRTERYSYRKEFYSDHVRRVLEETDALLPAYQVTASRIGTDLGLCADQVGRLVRIVAAAHDLGKLSTGVQDAMWRWMRAVHGDTGSGFLAHTTFDAWNPGQAALVHDSRFKKPPHAMEGAYAAKRALSAEAQRLGMPVEIGRKATLALFSAIGRHHSPSASTVRSFELSQAAREEAGRLLNSLGIEAEVMDKPSSVEQALLPKRLVDPATGSDVYPLYLFVVRLLRIADQRATARKE